MSRGRSESANDADQVSRVGAVSRKNSRLTSLTMDDEWFEIERSKTAGVRGEHSWPSCLRDRREL